MTSILKNEMNYTTGFVWFGSSDWTMVEEAPGIMVATAPERECSFPARQCVPSWNIISGHNGWSEVFLRARLTDGTWTVWYRMGLWASEPAYMQRFSLSGQENDHGKVDTDVLTLKKDAEAFQMKIRLCETMVGGLPTLRGAALTWSSEREKSWNALSSETGEAVEVENLPAHSQKVYKDGGGTWCSPTSLSMVIQKWRQSPVLPEAAVREAVRGTFDPIYGGNGNWSFNAAWAGSMGYRAYVRRFTRLRDLRPYLEAGIPVILSVSWDKKKDRPLDNSPINSTDGHLIVLKGFDGKGNALIHEPASPTNEEVPRSYPCEHLQPRWMESSGGTAYIVFPADREDPGL